MGLNTESYNRESHLVSPSSQCKNFCPKVAWFPIFGLHTTKKGVVSAYDVSGTGCNVLYAGSHFYSQRSHEENTIIFISQKKNDAVSNKTASKWQGLD